VKTVYTFSGEPDGIAPLPVRLLGGFCLERSDVGQAVSNPGKPGLDCTSAMWKNSGLSELSGSAWEAPGMPSGATHWGSVRMFGVAASGGKIERRAAGRPSTWTKDYLRQVALADLGCAVVGVFMAAQVRFGSNVTPMYLGLSLVLPVLWIAALWLAGAYDVRFIGTGSDEYRRVLNAGVSLTAAVAIFSYTVNLELSRAYVVIALPSVTVFVLFARFAVRKRLHQKRMHGKCLHNVVAVGHELAVADLVTELGRDRYHGLTVVAACVVRPGECDEVVGVPVYGGLDDITAAVKASDADTVAVTTCPEMDGVRLRSLAWELEKTGTDLCVSPALLDVAGPRTTIRPTAGLTLLHVDHPQLTGFRLVLKGLFDRCVAAAALIMLAPAMAILTMTIWLHDRGPAVFTQVRIGKDGREFRIYKFRTMVVDAEKRQEELLASNDSDGVLFKLREDPRVTPLGARLRRWSMDELPQLFNVFLGDMSLVGPRPAVPDEVAKYADHVRRRLVVKPGLTGLWQVNGRSDLSWDESVRLDLRYVENWSFALDLQILWKTISALTRGSGAY
jgi:exopolysaccharide biosynthesis polyprenyl glycosylphosphotransferase